MILDFDTHGNEKQKLAATYWLDPTINELGFGGGKGGGKSFLGVNLIFGDAFTYPDTRFFIGRKKLNDLRKHTIPTIHEVFKTWGIDQRFYSFNATDNTFHLNNKSAVLLIEAKYLPSDPLYSRFGSMQMTRGWIEEAGEFEYNARANLAASIGRWKNDVYNLAPKLLETCNPSKNYLYEEYYKNDKNGTMPDFRRFVKSLLPDNKMIPKGYADQLERTLTKQQKERLIHGNWEYDDDPLWLIDDYDLLIEMFNSERTTATTKRYITADIARYGSDKAVVMVWDGWDIIDMAIFDISSTVDIKEKIKAFQRLYGVMTKNTLVDQDGVGGGVMDELRCKGFTNNAKSIEIKGEKENFNNIKSQCGFHLAKKINAGQIIFKCYVEPSIKQLIISDCEVLKRTDDLKLSLISKDDMKKLIGRSPDFLDSILMRSFFDLNLNSIITKYGTVN